MTRQASILLVADYIVARESLGQAITKENYNVLTAGSSEEAVQVFAKNSIDAVVLDLDLPNGGAREILRRLRRVQPSPPVILITDSLVRNCSPAELGANVVMEKPLHELPMLIQHLSDLVRGPEELNSTKSLLNRCCETLLLKRALSASMSVHFWHGAPEPGGAEQKKDAWITATEA